MISSLMNNVGRWCGLLVAAVLVTGCSSGQDSGLAEAGIARFRELMAAQQFGQIYSEAADDLKKATTEPELLRLHRRRRHRAQLPQAHRADQRRHPAVRRGQGRRLRARSRAGRGRGAERRRHLAGGGHGRRGPPPARARHRRPPSRDGRSHERGPAHRGGIRRRRGGLDARVRRGGRRARRCARACQARHRHGTARHEGRGARAARSWGPAWRV